MLLRPHIPRPPLDRYVELIWVVRGHAPGSREQVLPNGAVELIFNLGAPHAVVDRGPRAVYRASWVSGMQERPLVIEAERETDLVGVRFRPGGAYPFLGVPLPDLTNAVVECDAVLSRLARELRERLLEAPDDQSRVAFLERALVERLLREETTADVWLPAAVASLERGVSVGEVARDLGMSPRHLTRRFRLQVGVSPKLLARILRLQRVVARVAPQSRVDWSQVALACGYFDQAHLIRDFRLLAGATPTEYLARRDANPNHLIVDSSP